MFELSDSAPHAAVIKVIGVGGGGGNAVEHMIAENIEGVEFVCANTDAQALRKSSARTILQLREVFTTGLGDRAVPDSRLRGDGHESRRRDRVRPTTRTP